MLVYLQANSGLGLKTQCTDLGHFLSFSIVSTSTGFETVDVVSWVASERLDRLSLTIGLDK